MLRGLKGYGCPTCPELGSTEKRVEDGLTSFINWLCTFSSFRHCSIEIHNLRLYKPGWNVKTSYFYFVIRTEDVFLYKPNSLAGLWPSTHCWKAGRWVSSEPVVWVNWLSDWPVTGKNDAYHRMGHWARSGKTKKQWTEFFFLSFLLQAVVLLMGIQRDKALVSWMLENRTKK